MNLWIQPDETGTAAKLGADVRDTEGGSHRILSSAGVIVADKWQHVALTFEKSTGSTVLYCDGNPVAKRAIGPLQPQTGLHFFIGRDPYAADKTTFKGDIDEVSIYKQSLSLVQILDIDLADSAGKQIVEDGDLGLPQSQRNAALDKRLADYAAKSKGAALTFASYIDGMDQVHIKGDKLWFVHVSYDLPGQNGGKNLPTRVDFDDWTPMWKGNISDPVTISPALPTTGSPVLTLDLLKHGRRDYIMSEPTAANGYEAIILLDDNDDPGAHWRYFTVSWESQAD